MPNMYEDIAFDDITEEDENEYYSTSTEDNDDRYVDMKEMSLSIKEAADEYSEEMAYM